VDFAHSGTPFVFYSLIGANRHFPAAQMSLAPTQQILPIDSVHMGASRIHDSAGAGISRHNSPSLDLSLHQVFT
jgi:hypothetical protein